jgi:membrane fusion protein, multidrug efflux system
MYFFSNKFFAFFISGISICALAACGGKKEDASKGKGSGGPKVLKAEGFVVSPKVYNNTYTASGSLLANESIDIHPETNGRVTKIFFTEGSLVKKGQNLVQLYNEDIIAQIQKLRAQRGLQVNILNRQNDLLRIGGISKQDFETTQTQIQSIDADIAYQEAMLAKTKIVAPFDGKIGIRNVSPGAVITTTSVIAHLEQVHPLKMDFTVPDQYRSNFKNGMKVLFNVDGTLDTLSGEVSAVDPGADPSTRTIRIRAIVPNKEGKLVSGSFAHILIPFQSNNDAIMIPSQAVIPTTRDKQVAVLENGKAKMQTIILGDRTADQVLVLQGLQSGDTILTTGLMQVKPNMNVTVTKVRS